MYTLFFESNLQAMLRTSSSCSTTYNSSKNTPTSSLMTISLITPDSSPTHTESPSPPNDTFSPIQVLLENYWVSLDFTPTFVGEYKVPPREPKIKKEDDVVENKKKPTLSKELSNNFLVASKSNDSS